MFIETLWKENPEFVIDSIKKICGINESVGDCLSLKSIEDGCLVFQNKERSLSSIIVSDFAIQTDFAGRVYDLSQNSVEWMKVMKSVFNDQYIFHYIAYRNEKLDKFLENYKKEYDEQTKKTLLDVDFDYEKEI